MEKSNFEGNLGVCRPKTLCTANFVGEQAKMFWLLCGRVAPFLKAASVSSTLQAPRSFAQLPDPSVVFSSPCERVPLDQRGSETRQGAPNPLDTKSAALAAADRKST